MNPKPESKFERRLRARAARATRKETTPAPNEPVTVGVPLAKLIKRKIIESPEVVMLARTRSVGAERFRRLKTILVNQYRDEAQVIVVTSGAPEEGKSTVAINLALAFAAEGTEKTLLLDADLRRPSIRRWVHPKPQLGLGEILARRMPLDHAVLSLTNSPLEVLPAGGSVSNPMELLATEDAKTLFSTLRERYRRIIVDTPPIVPFSDADAIGALGDGILMVVRAETTPTSLYQQALGAVTSTRILGTVFNGTVRTLADSTRYYDGYYERYDEARTKR
jgi:capsular exopolysaccharide synthesis family protein